MAKLLNSHSVLKSFVLTMSLILSQSVSAQLNGEILQPLHSQTREVLETTLKSQFQLMLVKASEAALHEKLDPMMQEFAKKYPLMKQDTQSNPFVRDLISGAVEKQLRSNFNVLHARLSEGATKHYNGYGNSMSPSFRAELMEVLPAVLKDLASAQSRSELIALTTETLQNRLGHDFQKAEQAEKEKNREQTETASQASPRSSEHTLPMLIQPYGKKGPEINSPDNLPVFLQYSDDSDERVRQDSPESIRRNYAGGITGAALEFGRQSTFFNIPVALIALSELGISYSKDPLAFDRFIASLKDPYSHVAFAAFMATNHALTHQLSGIMNGTISRSLLPYIGMSAGFLASSIVGDLAHDQELHSCARSIIGAEKDTHKCEVTYNNWVPSRKIDNYMPSILSMANSTLLSGIIQSSIKLGANGRNLMWSARVGGLRMVRATAQMAVADSAAGGPLALIGSYTLFLVVDKIGSSVIDEWWKRTTLQKWDFSEYLSESTLGNYEKHLHLVFFKTLDLPNVKVGTLPAVHFNLQSSLKHYDENHWQNQTLQECLPADLQKLDFFNLPGISRRDDIKQCLIERDMVTNLKNMGEVQGKWRQFLLRKMNASSQSWTEALYNFNTLFNGSTAIYKKMIDGLQARALGKDNVAGAAIDLSHESFVQLTTTVTGVKPTAQQTSEEATQNESLFPSSMGGMETTDLTDFFLQSMACGPDMNAGATLWQKARSFSWLPLSWLNEQAPALISTTDVPSPQNQMVDTPFGEKFVLRPPAIVKNPGELCRLSVTAFMDKEELKKAMSGRGTGVPQKNLYDKTFILNGQTYHGILDYIIKNINPELLGTSQRGSDFSLWWDDKVVTPAEEVWAIFRKDYVNFTKKNLVPLMRPDQFRQGCTAINSSCIIRNPTVTIADDLVESFQIEMVYHQEVLKSILASLTKDMRAAGALRNDLDARMNSLVGTFGASLDSEVDSFDKASAEKQLKDLSAQVNQQLDGYKVESEDYRRKVMGETFRQLQNILSERDNVRQFLQVLVFSDRNEKRDTRPQEKKPFSLLAR